MNLTADENFPVEALDLFRAAGHDILSVLDESLNGWPDSRIASVCKQEGRALITLDTDFSDIRTYRPADWQGRVSLRSPVSYSDYWKSSRPAIATANCGLSNATVSESVRKP